MNERRRAAPRRPGTNERIRRQARRRRRAWLKEARGIERELELVAERLARRVEAAALALATPTLAAVARIVRTAFDAELSARIEAAARLLETAGESARQAIGDAAEVALENPPTAGQVFEARAQLSDVRIEAAERLRKRLRIQRLRLARSLHVLDRQGVAQVAGEIQKALRAGFDVRRVATAITKADNPIAQLPGYVRELDEAVARGADVRELRGIVAHWRSRVNRLGQGPGRGAGDYTLRSASRQLLEDAESAGRRDLKRKIDQWVRDKVTYQSRLVARTEATEAYDRVYRETAAGQPWVVGLRWTLSAMHPEVDVCDVLASQDLHGLGPGVYPANAYPPTPHPADLCYPVSVIDDRHFDRQLARARNQPEPPRSWESGRRETGAEWLARQPEPYRLGVLGPGRAAIFDRDPTLVMRPDGSIRTLAQATALRKRRA